MPCRKAWGGCVKWSEAQAELLQEPCRPRSLLGRNSVGPHVCHFSCDSGSREPVRARPSGELTRIIPFEMVDEVLAAPYADGLTRSRAVQPSHRRHAAG